MRRSAIYFVIAQIRDRSATPKALTVELLCATINPAPKSASRISGAWLFGALECVARAEKLEPCLL